MVDDLDLFQFFFLTNGLGWNFQNMNQHNELCAMEHGRCIWTSRGKAIADLQINSYKKLDGIGVEIYRLRPEEYYL